MEQRKKKMQKIAECINILGDFCGKRDVSKLTRGELEAQYGFSQADVMVLFGGSILEGGRIFAEAMKQKTAKTYVIVGGEGHTTETLRQKMHAEFSEIETKGLPEAMVYAAYLKSQYGLAADYLECRSTNCGNNITYLLELLSEKKVDCKNMIFVQDAAMQRRMEAGMRKLAPDITVINYAAYHAVVCEKDGRLAYGKDIWGMWDMEHYLSLLMGEIPRLTDDRNGYGPCGSDYIAHVDIPERVQTAFEELKAYDASSIRKANPLYASLQK